MGYLLKEALKTLCGVNQWSYAVFWKIGCQNPKTCYISLLLIWEDCYYETASCSGLSGYSNPFHDYNATLVSAEARDLRPNVQPVDKVHLLVNKMMMDNQVNILGEGLIGRVAFTGNHHWIIAESYYREAHPPEVQKEMYQQISADMQTVAVIPVLPHGVVQFGSSLIIMENTGFINDVTSLLLELWYLKKLPREYTPNGVHAPCSFNTFNYVDNSCKPSSVETQTSFSLTSTQIIPQHYPKIAQPMKLDFSSSDQITNLVAKAEIVPSNSEMWRNQNASRSALSLPSNSDRGIMRCTEQKILSNTPKMHAQSGDIISKNPDSSELYDVIFSKTEAIPGFVEDDEKQNLGDDLFDVLGAGFKNKLFNNFWNSRTSTNESTPNVHTSLPSDTSQGNSESGIFSPTNSDHLLEAVVFKIHPSTKCSHNDNVSCTTNVSSLSEPNSSLPYGRFGISCPFTDGPPKEELGNYAQVSSIHGSTISSWIKKDQKGKQNSSVSSSYSEKTDETSKTNRKRLKPGENPRPRPKDRQMIQDRFKELREIVPNGAKCSIDSLLERTIKHMLFLQSVAKHADELNQTGESKIISKDGGLLLKDNFEGGATWAYEVGSQSMVCPIIVEDLNQPRQMLVEMLCEERGLFLEIADIIRGLGLTILKGVMETRNDKIWARFAVEADRDVRRMEIFISLVRRLDQSAKNCAQPHGIINQDSTPQTISHSLK
ncbi:hypothetical protein OROGR_022188 [Orobanche gracilis]